MRELTDQQIVANYRRAYNIDARVPLDPDDIRLQYNLEREIRQILLASTPEERAAVFEREYTRYYETLRHLLQIVEATLTLPDEYLYSEWVDLIGTKPMDIYEVGSGQGRMISYLASLGHRCTATEITAQRGESQVSPHENLRWTASDGVHLDRYEAPNSYDFVLSDQVIEHLHPDDIVTHFTSVNTILKPGGCYLFRTPHQHLGPWDIGRVFKCREPVGLHLKEYSYHSITGVLKQAKLGNPKAIFSLPKNTTRSINSYLGKAGLRIPAKTIASRFFYFWAQCSDASDYLHYLFQGRIESRWMTLGIPRSVFLAVHKRR